MKPETSLSRRHFTYGAAAALALAGSGRAFAQDSTPNSDQSEIAPQLPAVDLPDMNEQGFLYNFESTWKGSFDSLPTEASVIRMDVDAYDKDRTAALAAKLGIVGDVTDQGAGSFEVSSDTGNLFVTPGLQQYVSTAKEEDGDLPSDDQALAYAREWLRQTALLPADAGDGIILARVDNPARVVVAIEPIRPGNLISLYPSITVTMGKNGLILEAAFRWSNLTAEETYALRPAAEAWNDIASQASAVQADLPSDFTDPGATVNGKATYTKADIAYSTSGQPGQTQYLQPVYVFTGTVRPDGADKDYTLSAYVPALVNSQQPVG